MNADLLAMLGGAGLPGPNSSRNEEQGKPILTFKAGKMDPVLQPNGKYLVTSDPRRGEINLVFEMPSTLRFEWKDRRTRAVVDSFVVIPEDGCTFTPVSTGREGDRVNLLQFGSDPDRRFFYWMQSNPENNNDEENVRKTQTFLSNLNECVLAAGGEVPRDSDGDNNNNNGNGSSSGGTGIEVLNDTNNVSSVAGTAQSSSATTNTTNSNNNNNNNQQQVDTLSNILSNLGMPQPSSATTPNNTNTNTNTSNGGGNLTLADLQGAMAGLATRSPPAPPLHEIATADAVEGSGLLDDPETVARLMALLPEGQRTEEDLRENLRAPPVAQALRALASALDGGASEWRSVVANFSMDAADGAAALNAGNPIQAFLDCLLRKVEREKKEKGETKDEADGKEGETKEEEKDGDDDNDNVPMTE